MTPKNANRIIVHRNIKKTKNIFTKIRRHKNTELFFCEQESPMSLIVQMLDIFKLIHIAAAFSALLPQSFTP